MKQLKVGRVVLSSEATKEVNSMINELQGGGAWIKGSPSDFISSVVSIFKRELFEGKKEALQMLFFDSKSYLKYLSSRSTPEEQDNKELKAMLKRRDVILKKNRLKTESEPLKTQEKEADS